MLVCSCVCLYTDITGENKTVIRVLPGPRTPDYTGRMTALVLSHRTIEHRTRYGYRTYDENLMFTVSDHSEPLDLDCPKSSPHRNISPAACRKLICLRPNSPGISQFQSHLTGYPKMTAATARITGTISMKQTALPIFSKVVSVIS